MRPVKGWAEQDALTGWRKVYQWTLRAGARDAVKRRFRRERHQAKHRLTTGREQ